MSAFAQYFQNIVGSLATTFAGMRVTIDNMRAPATTLQYPSEKMPMFERFRGLLHNRIEDCIGCGKCVRACPVDCISMVTQKAGRDENLGMTRDGTQKKLHVYEFDIDLLKCMWCDLCVEVCPTACLTMSADYEASTTERQDWTLRFATETPPPDFDLEAARIKQRRPTNPVEFEGEVEDEHLEIPDGAARPVSAAAEFDHTRLREAAIAAADAGTRTGS